MPLDTLKNIAYLVAVTAIPGLELRASVPFGIFGRSIREALGGWGGVAACCFVANIVIGELVFWVMGPVVSLMRRWEWFDRRIWPFFARTQEKLRPYVDKYGEMGVAVFIGVPLPGTGVYTGAFGAYLLGLDRRKFMVANIAGVAMACAAVTAICLLIDNGVVGPDSWLRRLFLKNS